MAFPQTLTNFVDGTTTILAAHLNALEKIGVGPAVVNAVGQGADPTGTNNSATAVQAAVDALGTGGGTVYFPPGLYRMDTTVNVPSRTMIRGAGMYATMFFAPAAAADIPVFEVKTTATNGLLNIYGQVYGVVFQDFEIRDRASADTPTLQQNGRSEDHHGIVIHDADWGLVRNVNFRDLRGYAINMTNLVREWFFDNIYVQGCGDSAETVPAVIVGSVSGDATNTIYFVNSRILFSEYRAVYIHGQTGIRLINFISCQIEGGGNGSGGTWGNPWPYDLVYVGRCKDLAFANCNLSNPGSGKWCVNFEGDAAEDIYYASIDGCRISGNNQGGGVRVNNTTAISVSATVFEAATAATGDYYVEATSGVIFGGLDNVHSGNPTAGSPAGHFRGRETQNQFNLGDTRLVMDGGGMTSHTAGKPTNNMGLGAPASNGMHKIYDITNFLWWERIFLAGIGDLWVPEPGQVVGRRSEQIYASNTVENSAFLYTIPAASMSYWGGIAIDVWGDFSGTGVGNATLRVKLGGTTVFADAGPALVSGVQPWHVRLLLRNNGASETAQRLGGYVFVGAVTSLTTGTGGDLAVDEVSSWSAVQASPAIDMAAANRDIEVTWQHSAAKVTTVRGGRAVWES